MKTVLYAAFAAGFLLPSAGAADELRPIQVEAQQATLGQWVRHVSASLDSKIAYPAPRFGEDYATGIVAITFRTDANGAPTDIVVARNSGNRRLDTAAARAVNALGPMAPPPVAHSSGLRFRADIVFATDEWTLRRSLAIVERERADRMARGAVDPTEVALVTASRVPG